MPAKNKTPKPKRDLRAIIDDLNLALKTSNDKAKTIALRLFDKEAENEKLKNTILADAKWWEKAKEQAGFSKKDSTDMVWELMVKDFRNGGCGWTSVKAALPPEITGPGHTSGWTAWLECTSGENTDSGLVVFTASYSHRLNKWHDLDQRVRAVTHYRLLPTTESIK